MPVTRVTVIVLNYRGERILRRCLLSLRPEIRMDDRVLVVDNGNETTLMHVIAREFPWVEIMTLPTNVGFAGGMNIGIRHSLGRSSDAFWLLNNDVVVTPGALDALKRAVHQSSSPALFSPIIYTEQGKQLWYAGGRINFWRMRTEHQHTVPLSSTSYETKFLTGCAIFIPQAAIDMIGLLDEHYFLYYEDAEYSLRAQRAGLPLWIVPGARLYHSEESRKNPDKTYWLVRSGVEFFLRESRGWRRYWVHIFLWLRKLKNRIETIHSTQPLVRAVRRAYTDASL